MIKAYYTPDGVVTYAHENVKMDLPFLEIEKAEFHKPMIDLESLQIYESATPEEISEHNKPAVPKSVTNAQLRLALLSFGILPSTITNTLNAIGDDFKREKLIALWEYANIMERENEQLNEMAETFNLTPEILDQLFILANEK
jgi:hypothetical protein